MEGGWEKRPLESDGEKGNLLLSEFDYLSLQKKKCSNVFYNLTFKTIFGAAFQQISFVFLVCVEHALHWGIPDLQII